MHCYIPPIHPFSGDSEPIKLTEGENSINSVVRSTYYSSRNFMKVAAPWYPLVHGATVRTVFPVRGLQRSPSGHSEWCGVLAFRCSFSAVSTPLSATSKGSRCRILQALKARHFYTYSVIDDNSRSSWMFRSLAWFVFSNCSAMSSNLTQGSFSL